MVEEGVIHISPSGNKVFNYMINYECNNNCVMCINEQPDRRPEPSFEEIKKRFSCLDKNINYVFITGGEPTIRPDFFRVMSYLAENFRGKIHLLTNARMFSYGDFVRSFREIGFREIIFGVPIYGHNKELFESVSRAKGSFEQTCKGIKNLLKAGYGVEIRVVIHRFNYRYLPEIAAFIIKEFPGVKRVFFATMEFKGNGLRNRELLFVDYDDIREPLQKAAEVIGDKTELSINQVPLCKLDEKYWKYADHCTVVPGEHMFLEECDKCKVKHKCSGIWVSYLTKENKPNFGLVTKKSDPTVIIYYNDNCNLDCRFCLREGTNKEFMDMNRRFSEIVVNLKGRSIIITGGEPTLDEKLAYNIKLAKEKGVTNIELQSNAILLSDKILAKCLLDAGVDLFNIHLSSCSEKKYNEITKSKGQFMRCIQGIDNLFEIDANVRFTFIITSLNYEELPDYIEFVYRNYPKIKHIELDLIRGNICLIEPALVPDLEKIEPFLFKALKKSKDYKLPVKVDGIPLCYMEDFPEFFVDKEKIIKGTTIISGDKKQWEECFNCKYKEICRGAWKEYLMLGKSIKKRI